jgi:hypothetical protein
MGIFIARSIGQAAATTATSHQPGERFFVYAVHPYPKRKKIEA